MEDVLGVLAILAFATPLFVMSWLQFRARQEQQLTLRLAIERGVPLTPALVARIVEAQVPAARDLRRGVISVAVGVAIVGLAIAVDDADGVRVLAGLAAFPLLVGVAYLGLARFGHGPADAEPALGRLAAPDEPTLAPGERAA